MWKKICAITGSVLAIIVAYFLGRNLNRGRVLGIDADIRAAGESLKRAGRANRDAGNAVADSKRAAGELADRNRDNQADVDRGKSILHNAKARADKNRNTDGDS